MLRTDKTPADLGFANFKTTKPPRLVRKTGIPGRFDRGRFLEWYNVPALNGKQVS